MYVYFGSNVYESIVCKQTNNMPFQNHADDLSVPLGNMHDYTEVFC